MINVQSSLLLIAQAQKLVDQGKATIGHLAFVKAATTKKIRYLTNFESQIYLLEKLQESQENLSVETVFCLRTTSSRLSSTWRLSTPTKERTISTLLLLEES